MKSSQMRNPLAASPSKRAMPHRMIGGIEGVKRKMLKYVSLLFALFTVQIVPFPTLAQRDFGLSNTAKEVFSIPAEFDALSLALIVGALLSRLLVFLGVIFFVFILHGGLKWMTAKGDKEQVRRAQNILLHSTVALVIILSAYAVATYVTIKMGEVVIAPGAR